jgi:hypothetical protein
VLCEGTLINDACMRSTRMTYCYFPIVKGSNEDKHVRDMPMVGRVHRVQIERTCCLEEGRERFVNTQ